MKKPHFWIWIIFSAAVLLVACQTGTASSVVNGGGEIGKIVQTEGGSYRDLSVAELLPLLATKDFSLVNVHVPLDGSLPRTDLSIPYDKIDQNLAKLPADKNAKIVLYCRSGSMSTTASKELVKLGYTNIWILSGGMYAWEQAGQKIEK